MITADELSTPLLTPVARACLLMAANTAATGSAEVTVSLTYKKQTDTAPRIAGQDYVALPGVSPEAQTGLLLIERYADNSANRKLGRAGKIYFKIRTATRANGADPVGFTNVRPEGITAFVVIGVQPIQPPSPTAQPPA